MTTITIPKKELKTVIKDYGYKSERDFIEDALLHRILELKKIEFLTCAKEVKDKMNRKKITEKDILKDFEKFYHRN